MKILHFRIILAFILSWSILLTSCYTVKPVGGMGKYDDSFGKNPNGLKYIDDPKYLTEHTELGSPKAEFGWFLAGAIPSAFVGLLGSIAAINIIPGYQGSWIPPALTGLLGGLLAVQIFYKNTPPAGYTPINQSQVEKWMQEFNSQLRVASLNYNKEKFVVRIDVLPAEIEGKYKITNSLEVSYFNKAFPNSPHFEEKVLSAIQELPNNIVEEIGVNPDVAVKPELQKKIVASLLKRARVLSDCAPVAKRFPNLKDQVIERAYYFAQNYHVISVQEEFLRLFPDSKYTEVVEKKRNEIQYKEYKEFFKNSKSAVDYDNFIAQYANYDPDKLVPKAKTLAKEMRYKEYKDAFTNSKSSSDFVAFIEKYKRNDPDNLVPKAKLEEYRKILAEAKTSSDYAAFIEKYASNDPDNLIPRAKAAEYQKLYEEAYSSSDCSRFMEKYANNDPNGYIPQVQEKRAAALEREEQARIAEAKRQEEERREQAKLQNRRWKVLLTNQQNRTSYNKYITTMGVGFTGRDEEYGSVVEDHFASNEITYDKSNNSYKIFLSGRRGSFVAFEVHYAEGILGNSWEVSGGVSPSDYYSNVFNLCRSGNISASTLTDLAIEIYINEFLRKPH